MKLRIIALCAAFVLSVALAQAQGTTNLTATATVGVAFSNKIASPTALGYLYTTGGTPNLLPAGLVYNNSTGILSGTPTVAGTYAIQLQQVVAGAAAGVYTTTNLALTIAASGTVTPPPATFCASSTNPACGVALSCTPSTSSTAKDPGTVTLQRRANGGAFATLASGLAPNCAYTDKSVLPSTSYDYVSLFVQDGLTSAASNVASVSVPAVVVVAPPPPNPPTDLTGTVVSQ